MNNTSESLKTLMSCSKYVKPVLSVDGNQWCLLHGDNLQVGICGFGDTPELAVEDFVNNYTDNMLKLEMAFKKARYDYGESYKCYYSHRNNPGLQKPYHDDVMIKTRIHIELSVKRAKGLSL